MAETKDTSKTETPEAGKRSALTRPFDEMERLYESIFSQGWLRPFQFDWPTLEKVRPFFSHRMPAVDVIDRDNEIIVKAEVPGVKKEDIKVSITDHTLTIRGSSEEKKEEKHESYYYSELSKGEFARSVTLPAEVDAASAKASMYDGILEIVFTKSASAKRAVNVEVR